MMTIPTLIATASLAAPVADARLIPWSPDTCIPVMLNGASLRLGIDTAMPVAVVLNPDAALRAGLKPSLMERLIDVSIQLDSIDPTVRLSGHFRRQAVRVFDLAPERAVVAWQEKTRVSSACDGFVSVWLVASPKVTLTRAAAPPPVRNFDISMTSESARAPSYSGRLPVGGDTFETRLDLSAPDSVVNAPAARRLVREGRLRLSGEVRPHPVRYGVARPAEAGQLINFKPYGLPVTEVFAHGPSVETPTHGPDEVAPVVVRGRPAKNETSPALTLGYKALANCRSLTFDRASHTFTLACAE